MTIELEKWQRVQNLKIWEKNSIKLSEEDRKEIKEEFLDVSQFEPLEGRKMREYIVLDEDIYRDIPTLEKWIERAISYVSSLPPKVTKQKKK